MFDLVGDIINFIFPPYCAICNEKTEPGNIICSRCFDSIYFIHDYRCVSCGRPIGEGSKCKMCGEMETHFDGITGCGSYIPPFSEIIRIFKYHNRPSLGKRLSRIMYSSYLSSVNLGSINTVTWVPMSGVELRERGYNQSRLLAEEFGAISGKNILKLLKKKRDIPSQTSLEDERRFKNIKGAFSASVGQRIADDSVIIVDDVLTTGSTVNECSRVLKEAGFENVFVLVLAISP